MNLEERIKDDIKTAMRSKNVIERDLLRVVISFIGGKKFKQTDILEDKEIFIILKSLVEGAKDTGNFHEVVILEKYLPQMLDEAGHLECIKKIVKDNNYTGMKQMGLIIKEMKETHIGRVDGKLMSVLIKQFFK